MLFRQGFTYIAGYDNPALVPNSTIESKIAGMGFKVLFNKPCEEYSAPFMTPPNAGPCDDEWDYVAAVQRVGPSRYFDLPDRTAWIITVPPAQLPPPGGEELPRPALPGEPPAAPPPPPPTRPALVHQRQGRDRRRDVHMIAEAIGLAVVAPVMWYAAREVSTPVLRTGLKGAAVGTAVVDAYLLWSYLTR